MRDIPRELLDQPFTSAMAASCGLTPRQVRGSRCMRLFHGVYVGANVEITPDILINAISLILPRGAVISGPTAALVHGADVRRSGDLGVYVTTLREGEVRRAGIRTTAAYLEEGDVVHIHGVPVTSAVRTTFDLARQRELIERVVGIDAMLNRGGCSTLELAAYIDDRGWWRGIRWAREALTHAEPKAESPMETRQRMRFVLGGLPRPQAQYTLLDRDGLFVARLDHAYEEWKVAPEYDGADHAETWRYDSQRHQRIDDEGWWHRGYTSLSIRDGWDPMIRQVGDALIARGWRP